MAKYSGKAEKRQRLTLTSSLARDITPPNMFGLCSTTTTMTFPGHSARGMDR